MNDPLLMCVLDSLTNLNKEVEALAGGKSLFITVVRDFDTTHQFHDEVRSASVGGSGIQHLGDIRMIHQRQGLAFGLETRDHLLGIHAQFDDLERHAPTHRFRLLRHIDDPTAAFANLLKELVAANSVARFFGGHLAGRNDPNCGSGRGVWSGSQTQLKQTGNTMPTRTIGWQFGAATRTFRRFTHTLFRSKADAQGRVVEKAAGFLVRPEQDLDALAQLCIFPAGALDVSGSLVRRLLQRGLENSLFAVVLLFHQMECYCILYHKAKSGKKKHRSACLPYRLLLRGGGLLSGFGLVQLGQFHLPISGFVWLVRGLIELNQALKGFRENLMVITNIALALLYAFIAGQQQRLGFGVLLLAQQTFAQQDSSVERVPGIRNFLFADSQTLAREQLYLGKSVLSDEHSHQPAHTCCRAQALISHIFQTDC